MIDIEKIRNHWIESSNADFKVAQDLFQLKHYAYCLFFCHLSIEKMLKAFVVKKTNNHAPFIHDLSKLAKLASLNLSEEQKKQLDTISTFNIRARYDKIKFKFYKTADEPYTKRWLEISEGLWQWLRQNQ